MVKLTLIQGRKGKEDVLVLVSANQEPFSFAEWLYLGMQYCVSEDSYYPVSKGYIGKAMLLNALNEVTNGVPFERVLERYKLKKKGKPLDIEDKRRKQ